MRSPKTLSHVQTPIYDSQASLDTCGGSGFSGIDEVGMSTDWGDGHYWNTTTHSVEDTW